MERNLIDIKFIGTDFMLADLLTKPVSVAVIRKLRDVMMGCLDVVQHVSNYVQLDVPTSAQTRLVGPLITTISVGDMLRDCAAVDISDELNDSLDGTAQA